MKRHQPSSPNNGGACAGGGGGEKGKLWEREEELPGNYSTGGGMDELLAVLGYRVRSADMAEVAEKMERLEVAMATVPPEESVAGFSADTVHYNPSDLPNWVQSMLSELDHHQPVDDQPQLFPEHHSGSSSPEARGRNRGSGGIYGDRYDLSAIPGDAVYCKEEPGYSDVCEAGGGRSKRMRASIKQEFCESSSPPSVDPPGGGWEIGGARPVVVVVNDSQDTGVCLVHALLACAEAVQQDDLKLADAIVKQIGLLAAAQAGAMGKVASYFAEALARRIYGIFPPKSPSLGGSAAVPCSYADMLEMHFYDSCPYLKFAHFTANQAILETLSGAERIHVVDLGLKQGLQWPALMQALALRPGGPPVFRLTGIVPPQQKTDGGGGVGWKLGQVALAVGLKFEFREVPIGSLADLEPSVLGIRPAAAETLVVNAVFELHRLLATAGAAEKVLGAVRGISPRLVTMAEQEANHNAAAFQDRFTEALHYYSTMFDSMEGSGAAGGTVMSEMYLGRQICEVVACEGAERGERHEPLERWRRRMGAAGFEPVRLGSNAFKQASMLVALFAGGDGYTVEERDACLTLGWHTRPLIATSAWQPR